MFLLDYVAEDSPLPAYIPHKSKNIGGSFTSRSIGAARNPSDFNIARTKLFKQRTTGRDGDMQSPTPTLQRRKIVRQDSLRPSHLAVLVKKKDIHPPFHIQFD